MHTIQPPLWWRQDNPDWPLRSNIIFKTQNKISDKNAIVKLCWPESDLIELQCYIPVSQPRDFQSFSKSSAKTPLKIKSRKQFSLIFRFCQNSSTVKDYRQISETVWSLFCRGMLSKTRLLFRLEAGSLLNVWPFLVSRVLSLWLSPICFISSFISEEEKEEVRKCDNIKKQNKYSRTCKNHVIS